MNKDNLPVYLAIGTACGFISLLWIMAFHDVPSTSHDILMASTGTLGTAFVSIISYYFGSSSGSAAKTAIMAKQTDKPEVKPTTT